MLPNTLIESLNIKELIKHEHRLQSVRGRKEKPENFSSFINDLTFLENLINGNSSTRIFKENLPKGELY